MAFRLNERALLAPAMKFAVQAGFTTVASELQPASRVVRR